MFCFIAGGGNLFLKSLDITGFKSFARTTRFEFTPGITALVGPNGSGKSNVVDAIRWCLGEQSVRDLRGQRAEDVIYAGSRHVLGVAEVSLTFAATTVESSSPAELAIARRLYRSGDSEYLVDGRRARLRDLLDRLRDLGIDGSRHIVVTQGMADALLSAAPTERRSLLEQAAGLSGYRVRRDEARQKLGTTEQNIATIVLVLGELEPRLRTLRRQARAVQDRQEAQTILRGRLHDWYAARWRVAGAELAELQTRTKHIADERGRAEAVLAELENASEAVLQDERAWQQRIDMLVAANRALEREREAADRVRSETDHNLNSLEAQRAGLDGPIHRARTAALEVELRMTEAEESARKAEADVALARAEEEGLGLKVDHARRTFAQAEVELQKALEAAAEHERSRSAELEHGARLEREIDRANRRREDLVHWLASAHGRMQEGEQETAVLTAEAAQVQMQVGSLTEQFEAAEQIVAAWRARGTRIDSILSRMKGAATGAQRRRDSATRALGTHDDGGTESVLQTISVQRGWEAAVAAALGSWAHAPVNGNARCSMHEDEVPGFAAWRNSLECRAGSGIWADSVVDGLVVTRINPLRTTLLAETGAEADRIWQALRGMPAHTVGTPALRVISKEGESWDAVGHIASSSDDRAASYLRLKREVSTMTRRYTTISARMSRLETARDESAEHRREAEATLESMYAGLRACRKHLTDLETRMAGLILQRTDLEERCLTLGTELNNLDDAQTFLASEYTQWESSHRELHALENELTARVDQASSHVESRRAVLSDLDHHRREARQRLEVALATSRAQYELKSAIRSEQTRLQGELTTGATDIAVLDQTVLRLKDERSACVEQVERFDVLLEEHSAVLSTARTARPTRHVSGDQVRAARLAVSNLVRQDERAQAESTNSGNKLDALRAEIDEELQVSPDELSPSNAEPPTEVEIKRLRSRSMQYADADPSVVAEAAELAERHAYLLKHVEDLRSAADTLRVMMEVADAEMRTQFDAAFAAVSEEFSRVFEVMLRGGNARLDQLDGGGIEVVAQLPGRRSRSSSAFSGGERSLIASSLLFGVLRMRPAPFCVLDEVDAALDEGNVDRYLAALRDISMNTQAIVVTHNRATMAAADVLYGLTMDSEGTSKALSLRLETLAAG
ncbi:MAG TPA: chromosome segregation protein SMC [Chloroflexota bacterium]